MIETCCICSLESVDGFDHESCFDDGTIRADEVDDE